MTIPKINTQLLKQDLPAFAAKTADFYAGVISKVDYKGFSGYYGSYAQRDGQKSMLRLRMNAGRVTKEKLAFTAAMIRKYNIQRLHFTTCQNIQLHDLSGTEAAEIMEQAWDAGIITLGSGGDYPRNVMCSPLSGVDKDEYFDVLPYAVAAGNYLLTFLKEKKLPRKLKVGFSNTPQNITHATFRDLGFAARPDGTFDVYSAGGLGNNPKLGLHMASAVPPEKILYYIKAMWQTFSQYGNYQVRGKARSRFLPEILGGEDAYKAAFNEKLQQIFSSGENLDLQPEPTVLKKRDFKLITGFRITPQKQPGLFAVNYHPQGGLPQVENFLALADYLQNVPHGELRLAPDQSVYIINLTAPEAAKVMTLTPDSAYNTFTKSVACIGSAICQQGVGDSQALLQSCFKNMATEYAACDALPQIYISGCPGSCGTHQTGDLGFRGTLKVIKGLPYAAYSLYVNGSALQGREHLGEEVGVLLADDIPYFLLEVGKHAAASGLSFQQWKEANPDAIKQIAQSYMDKIALLNK